MKFFHLKIMQTIAYATLLFITFYLFTGYMVGFDFPKWHIEIPIFSSLLWGLFLSHSNITYSKYILLPLALALSIYLIFPLSEEIIPAWDLYTSIGFHSAILLSLFILGILITKPRWKKLYFIITLFLYLIFPLLLWSYFSISHTWPQVDTLIAIYQTNPSEACGYLTSHPSFKILPIVFIFLACIYFISQKAQSIIFLTKHSSPIIFSLLLLVLAGELGFLSLDNPLCNLWHDTQAQITQYQKFKELKESHHTNTTPLTVCNESTPGLFVLVIGESENRDHMNAYGYPRDTTPWLSTQDANPHFLRFKRSYSCYVQTVQSLSYALTSKNQYNTIPLEQAVTLIEAAKAAGYETWWISNQTRYGIWDSPTTVIASGSSHEIWVNQNVGETGKTNFYDGKIVDFLQNVSSSQKTLLIIHLMGNHMPYVLRFPKEYNLYHGKKANLDNYDNSIRYNDEVMHQIYNTVSQMPNFQAMVYCSDHGEGIDSGLDHDVTNYTPAMTHIPLYMAFSDTYLSTYPDTVNTLRSHQEDIFTNDLLFNAMLGLMHIEIKGLSEPENDLTSPQYDNTPSRFRTLFGRKELDK